MEKIISIILTQELVDMTDRAIVANKFSYSIKEYLINESVLGLFSNIPLQFGLLPDEPVLNKVYDEKNNRYI